MAPGKVCLYLPFVVIVCTSMALGMVERPTRTPPPVSVLSKGIPGAPVSSPRQQGYRIAPKQEPGPAGREWDMRSLKCCPAMINTLKEGTCLEDTLVAFCG